MTMPRPPSRLYSWAWIALAALLQFTATAAAQDLPPPVNLEISAGHESITSPVVRIDPNGPLVRIGGLHRLAGNIVRTAAGASRDWNLGNDARFMLSGRVDWKESPTAADLGFGFVNADGMFFLPAGGWNLGAGPALRRLWVAGKPFRDTTGLQANLIRPTPDSGYWGVFADVANHRHHHDASDFDSRAGSLSAQWRGSRPLPGIDAMDLQVGTGRERNAHGFDDLSSRSHFLRLSAETAWAGLDWSTSAMTVQSRFDAPLLDTLPVRRDRFRLVEFSIAYKFGKGHALHLDLQSGRNLSNVALFETRIRYSTLGMTLAF